MDSDMPELIDNIDMPPSCNDAGGSNVHPTTMTNGINNSITIPYSNLNHSSDEEDDDNEENYNYMVTGHDSDDGNIADAFIGCQETQCLICEKQLESPEQALTHMTEAHQFDLVNVCISNKLDQIMYVKLINYMRRNKSAANEIKTNSVDIMQLDDTYMKPFKEEDAFLLFDIELYLEELREQGLLAELPEDAVVAAVQIDLQAQNEELRHMVCSLKTMLNRMAEDVTIKKETVVGDRSLEDDAGYFDSYSNYDIHHEMLSDKVRTESYRDAIMSNPSVMKGARVLDLGCGMGILSMFCAKAEAASVTAVEMAAVADDAKEIVRANKLGHIIEVIKGRLEDQRFEHEFDVIVSEWMGYFLLFEGMLDSVMSARDRFLKPGGTMMPNRCTMHLTAVDDKELHANLNTFWDDVYGFDMSCIRRRWLSLASTIHLKQETVATSSAQIAEFNMNHCRPQDTTFSSKFSLTPLRTTQLTAFAGYFDTFFDLPDHPVMFSTGPHTAQTHWKQTVFLLPKPLDVVEGVALEGIVRVCRHAHDVRALEVTFSLAGKKTPLSYTVE